MLITCPTCTTSYRVHPAALGEAGRTVRCSRCQATWFADAVAAPSLVPSEHEGQDADEAVRAFRRELAEGPQHNDAASGWSTAEEPSAHNPPYASTDTWPDPETTPPMHQAGDEPMPGVPPDEAPPLAPLDDAETLIPATEPRPDIETAARRRSKRVRRPRKPRSRLPALIVVFAAALASLAIWRGPVVRHAPQTAALYAAIGLPVNLRGLDFVEVKTLRDMHDGVPVLVVEGRIVNATAVAADVPRLRFAVQNASGSEVYSWTAQPAQPVLAAGQALPFRSRLASPPGEGQSVMVRFFTHRDAAGGAL